MKPQIQFDIILPSAAREIVEREHLEDLRLHHRPTKAISLYASDMLAGRWQINGDPIIFDTEGGLIDGRKRILASATENVAFPTMIVSNISPDAANYIDLHKRRTSKDVLYAAGYEDAGNFAAVMSAVADIGIRGVPSQSMVSHGNLLRMAKDFPGVQQMREEALSSPVRRFYSPSDLAALMFLTRRVSESASIAFFAGLHDAIENRIPKNKTPLQSLAGALLSLQSEIDSGAHRGSARTRYIQVIYTVKAWNAVRNGARTIHLKHDAGRGETPPLISGLDTDLFSTYLPTQAPETKSNPAPAYADQLKTKKPKAKVETITPEIATQLLEKNGPLHDGMARNRTQSQLDIAAYRRDIESGRWFVTGQTIKISRSGRLLDGQHRLEAIRAAGIPVDVVVVRDLADDIFSTFDVAHQHTLANVLTARGEASSTALQGALKTLWRYREFGFGERGGRPTMAELLDLFEISPGLRDAVRTAHSVGFRTLSISGASLATLIYIFEQQDAAKSKEFFDALSTGARIDAGTPVHALRESLMRLNNWASRNKRITVSSSTRRNLICTAWVAFLEGKNIRLPKEPKAINSLGVPSPFDKPAAPTIARAAPKRSPGRPSLQTLNDLDEGWIDSPAA